MRIKPMKVLLTGCNGQVGSELTKLFALNDFIEVLAINKSELDITNELHVQEIVTRFSPNYIINTAAFTQVELAEEQPYKSFAVNCDGVANLAKAALSVDSSIIHLSTDYVFDGSKNGPYLESDQINPISVYGKSKAAGEKILAEITKNYVIIRTSWVFGEQGSNFVKTMLKLGREKDVISVIDNQFGGPTFAKDLANLIYKIVFRLEDTKDPDLFGLYHFCGEPYVSWYEFASVILINAEKQNVFTCPVINPINSSLYKSSVKRPLNSRLCNDKVFERFNIKASDWRKALENVSIFL